MTITEWMAHVHKIADDHGWHDDCVGNRDVYWITAKLMLVVTEIAEAVEDLRASPATIDVIKPINQYGGRPVPSLPVPEGFTVELADALIRIFDLAHHLGLPLEEAVKVKSHYNESRDFRHGNKSI